MTQVRKTNQFLVMQPKNIQTNILLFASMFKPRMTLKMPRDLPNHSELRMMMMIPRTPMISHQKSRLIIWCTGKKKNQFLLEQI